MSLTKPKSVRNATRQPRLSILRMEAELLDAISNLREAAKDTLLDVAQLWRAQKLDARPHEMLSAAIDIMKHTEGFARAFEDFRGPPFEPDRAAPAGVEAAGRPERRSA